MNRRRKICRDTTTHRRIRNVAVIAAAALVAVVGFGLGSLPSSASSATSPAVRLLYYQYCGVEGKPGQCDLRTTSETFSGNEVVANVKPWWGNCGPGNGHASETISADGTTAVVLANLSSNPASELNPVCRIIVTSLVTGESRMLPAYSGGVLKDIQANGWSLSPSGEYIAISGRGGVYIQNVAAGTAPKLLRTGFLVSGVGWYPDALHLLVDGPALPLGGRGPVSATNSFFKYTLSGQRLARWQVRKPYAYQLSAPFIEVTPRGKVLAAIEDLYDPTQGGKPNLPAGYYSLSLGAHTSAKLLTRLSRTAYIGVLTSFGADEESGLLFILGGENKMCAVTIASGGRHCLAIPGSTEVVTVSGIQLAPSP